ncbi:restriction endonuclease [Streptomyces fructofermentans]|nr:restriction endonuclease [Streptomyces fructofermentans]
MYVGLGDTLVKQGRCPVCGRRVPIDEEGIVRSHPHDESACKGAGRSAAGRRPPEPAGGRKDDTVPTAAYGPRTPGDTRYESIAGVVGCVTFLGLVALLVGAFVSPVMWGIGTGLLALGLAVLWVLGRTPAGRRSDAYARHLRAEREQETADAAARAEQEQVQAQVRERERRTAEAALALRQAVRALLDDLPPRGTPQEEALEHCLSGAGLARQPRLRAEAARLARAHIAVDERILCVARSTTLTDRQRPALLILTDRGGAVADKGLSYRCEPGPQDVVETPDQDWGELRVGELAFPFGTNPGLRVALAARAEAAARPPAPARADRPGHRLIRTARDAELVAVDWMRHLGFTDAVATPVGADEGIDVLAEHAVAQVKKEGSPTSRPVVQQLHGVAVAKGRAALFFALAGYTPPAVDWASRHGIALFQYDLQGTPTPVNPPALQLMQATATSTTAPGGPGAGPRAPGTGRAPASPRPRRSAPASGAREEEFARQAERAGLRAEVLQDIADAVVCEQRATLVMLQERFALSRPLARRALEALEHLGVVSAPSANGRRTVTAASLDHL